MNDSFSALHPALTFCYFAAVLLLTMLVLHPVFLALSLLGALGYCAVLRGWRSLGRTLGWLQRHAQQQRNARQRAAEHVQIFLRRHDDVAALEPQDHGREHCRRGRAVAQRLTRDGVAVRQVKQHRHARMVE